MPKPDSNQVVARNVRRLRRERGLSQEEFGARCGLHRTYIGSIERGESNITLRTLDLLAQALCVPPSTLLTGRLSKRSRGGSG